MPNDAKQNKNMIYHEPPPESPSPSGVCQRVRTTKQGSNPHSRQVKCRDCGAVLEKEKLAKSEQMKTEDEQQCKHEIKTTEDQR